MVFYKGAISYQDFVEMPIPTLHEICKEANKMNEEEKREMKKSGL